MTATLVARGCGERCRLVAGSAHRVLDAQRREVIVSLENVCSGDDVGRVVLAVADFHRWCVEMDLESTVPAVQCGKLMHWRFLRWVRGPREVEFVSRIDAGEGGRLRRGVSI